ncbi:MAG: triose-phosphate isomerase, partial [Polaromonas sp.]|nr:triose-phosphate isomerase [Polaromonas sp.]
MKKLIAGNWKMNGGLGANEALMAALAQGLAVPPICEIVVCVPA